MKKLCSCIFAVLLLVSTILSALIPSQTAMADTTYTIRIHYHRYAQDYDGWNIWSWVGPGEGASYEFSEEDEFGAVATYQLSLADGDATIGFIVRHSTSDNAWDAKDIPDDRFIEVSKANGGVLDVYLVQDEQTFGYSKDEINLEPTILSAIMEDNTTVKFNVTLAFDISDPDILSKIKVIDTEGKEHFVSSIESEQGEKALEAVVTLKDEFNLTDSYTLEFEGYGSHTIANYKMLASEEFEKEFTYDGDDLGAVWSKEKTNFRLWAPTASEVILNLYTAGAGGKQIKSVAMTKDVKGTWITEESGDLNQVYYTYSVTVDGVTKEAVDPYAKAVGANGERGMIVDLDSTDPSGFEQEKKPEFVAMTDAILYELHIRDFSMDKNSGITNRGKYLAFTETGTTTSDGAKTGIDYLVDLGITHVHLMPSFDYATVDETKLVNNEFNWGYDPQNYNVPEGSYSTDPQHGEVRINEYKQMVQSLHENGIRVVMDVVYNHTNSTESNFNKVVPGYYYRLNEDGTFSNASGCNNETASERSMMRKYIIDSVKYWAMEYHVDGFRFDLMGIHDIETMNAVREALNEIDPTIIVYGEGWTGGASTLPEEERAMKVNVPLLDSNIAAFSDDIRDGIKGSVFVAEEGGFVSGREGMEETIKFGVVASTENDQIDYSLVNYSDTWWAKEPTQTVNYASAHDNNTLWDKINITNASDSLADRIKMNLMSAAIVLTSQGIPFFQAGEEILRSKPSQDNPGTFDSNSYKSSDAVNSIKWDEATQNQEVYQYYKGLIALRKEHGAFRMTTTKEIQDNLTFLNGLEDNVVAYTIDNSPNGEQAENICVIYNANKTATSVTIPEGNWNVYVKGMEAGTEIIETVAGGTITVDPISTLVLMKSKSDSDTNPSTNPWYKNTAVIATLIGAVILVSGVVGFLFRKRKIRR